MLMDANKNIIIKPSQILFTPPRIFFSNGHYYSHCSMCRYRHKHSAGGTSRGKKYCNFLTVFKLVPSLDQMLC